VASIAFGEPVPAVDGNVRRVLSRLLDADLPPAALQRVARVLVPARRPGDFNQGLMELGATLCRPRKPRCGNCPVRGHCRARAAGTQALRPARASRTALPEHHLVTLVLRSPAGLLLTRPNAGLLARMWRFPATPLAGDVHADAAAAIRRLTGDGTVPTLHGVVSHTFSHRREHYHVASAALPDTPSLPVADEWRWVGTEALGSIPLPAAQRRILGLVLPEAA
jgi:A/G-specific adenine glycosylase